MAGLLCDTPIANSQRPGEHPPAWHRAGGIAGRDEHDLNAGGDQASNKDVDDVLGASVGDWGDGQPWWGDDAHAEGVSGEVLVWGLKIEALGHDAHGDRQPDAFPGS
jgi:hypothetical protein